MKNTIYCKKCHAKLKLGDSICPNCCTKVNVKKSCLPKILIGIAILFLIGVIVCLNVFDNDTADKIQATATAETTPKAQSATQKAEPTQTHANKETKSEENQNIANSKPLTIYKDIQDNDTMPFTITQKALAMLSDHPELFENNSKDDLATYTDTSIQYKHLKKNINNYGDKLIYLPEAYVMSIKETDIDSKTVFTDLQLCDLEGNSFYAFSQSKLPDIFENDIVEFYGLPLGDTSFSNIGGGTTLAVVCAGCFVQKKQ